MVFWVPSVVSWDSLEWRWCDGGGGPYMVITLLSLHFLGCSAFDLGSLYILAMCLLIVLFNLGKFALYSLMYLDIFVNEN